MSDPTRVTQSALDREAELDVLEDHVREALRLDREAGLTPFCVVASAGTTKPDMARAPSSPVLAKKHTKSATDPPEMYTFSPSMT